jgi:hypothetical protein
VEDVRVGGLGVPGEPDRCRRRIHTRLFTRSRRRRRGPIR